MPVRRRWDIIWDTAHWDLFVGLLAGAGAAFWFYQVATIRHNEATILLATAGVAVGLLAVTLAAMTLIVLLFRDVYRELFKLAGGKFRDFLRPFKIVAIVSGCGTVTCIFGAMDAGDTAQGLGGQFFRATLYGASVALVVWAIFGAVQLVSMIIRDGADSDETGNDDFLTGADLG